MRRVSWALIVLVSSALVSLGSAGLAQAAPLSAAAPTAVSTTINGHPAVLHALQGTDVTSVLAKINTADAQAVRPNATNPCFGDGLLCLFQNTNGGGAIDAFTEAFLFEPGAWNLSNDPLGSGTWNDKMSSWGNDIGGNASQATMCWWVNSNRGGAGHLMRPLGATIQNLLPSENDTASSVDTKTSACK